MPWIGYHDLIDRADVFDLLDNDAMTNAPSWQQRNRIKTPKGLAWLTVPVRRSGHTGQAIRDVEIADARFWRKHLNTINANYARAAFFPEYRAKLAALFDDGAPPARLSDVNIAIIKLFAQWAELTPRFVLASELPVSGSRTDRLVAICRELGGDTYLSPLGAIEYLADDGQKFADGRVSLAFQNYAHPEYTQVSTPFVPFASAVDLFLNEGPNAARIMRSGRRPDLTIEQALETLHDGKTTTTEVAQ
ncbi:MAG: WbqC family protein [Rhodospirillaceae bacterium]